MLHLLDSLTDVTNGLTTGLCYPSIDTVIIMSKDSLVCDMHCCDTIEKSTGCPVSVMQLQPKLYTHW